MGATNSTPVAFAAGVLLLLTACTASMPTARGTGVDTVAPKAPNQIWHPPAGAEHESPPAASLSTSVVAPLPAALTLGDVVDLALRNNPATRASWAQARAAADAYGVARGAYFPSVSANVDVLRTQSSGASSSSIGAGSSSIPGRVGSGTTAGGTARSEVVPSLSLTYLVYDFGGRSGSTEGARQTAYAVSFTHNATVQSTVLQAEGAYYMYAGARAILEAQGLSVREAQASYAAAHQRDSVGLATIADVLQARTALGQAQLALEAAQAQVFNARGTLALAMGMPPNAPFDVPANVDDVRVGDIATSVESLMDEALHARPDLQAAYANAAAARAAVRVARASSFPSIVASGTTLSVSGIPSSVSGRSYTLSFGVQVPLFDGFSRAYDVARARALAHNAAAQAEATRQTILNDVATAYNTLQTATQQVRTSDELLASASASLRAAQARYRAGLGSIIDLLAAQGAMATARAQHGQVRWAWAQQLAVLAHAAGSLDARGTIPLPITPIGSRPPLP